MYKYSSVTNESHKRAKSLIHHKDDTIHKSKKKDEPVSTQYWKKYFLKNLN